MMILIIFEIFLKWGGGSGQVFLRRARLYKTPESGNGTKMSDKKWRSANSRYLKSEKW